MNESKAYHAFDEDPTTQWVSHSNKYNVTTGDYQYNLFTDKLFGTDNLGNIGITTINGTNYDVAQWAYNASDNTVIVTEIGYYAASTQTTNHMKITLDGVLVPNSGKQSSGNTPFTSASALISAYNSGASPHHSMTYTFTKNALFDLAVTSKLASTTDAGEYIKLALGSAIEATTLTLKSVSEYKEPRINMSGYNQCGYEVSASSEYNTTAYMAWQVFDNLRTGSPNPQDDLWGSSGTSYDSSNSHNANTVRQLATGTEYGEWVKLKLPDKRKLVLFYNSRQPSYGWSRNLTYNVILCKVPTCAATRATTYQ